MSMTVSELIEFLEQQDPDATVFIMAQEDDAPFECDVAGLTVREDFIEGDGDEDGDDKEPAGRKRKRGTAASDVFIVQGDSLRRGTREAWRLVG